MNSRWGTEVRAVFRKELACELRSRTGLLAGFLFVFSATVCIGFATFGVEVSPQLCAGLLWTTMLFGSVIVLPRAFVTEVEQGTFDLLQLTADPHAVFWGKALFNALLTLFTGLAGGTLLLVLTNNSVMDWGLVAISLVAGSFALASVVTLCGALAAHSSNRASLAGVIALPLLMPVLFVGVAVLRVGFGQGVIQSAWMSASAMVVYAVATSVMGPYLYASVTRS